MNTSAFVWAAFGGALVLFAIETWLVWRAGLAEHDTAREHAPASLRLVSRRAHDEGIEP